MSVAVEPRRNPVDHAFARLAARLGCSEGQAYTVVIGVALGVALSAIGIPPTLRDRPDPTVAAPRPAVSAPPAATADEPAPAPDVTDLRPPVALRDGRAPSSPPSRSAGGAAAPAPPPSGGGSGAPAPPFGTVTRLASLGEHGEPEGVAVLPDGAIAVGVSAGQAASKVLLLAPNGSVQAVHEIAGQAAGERRVTGLAALDGRVVVLDTTPARILALDPASGAQEVLATLPDLQPCIPLVMTAACQPGLLDVPALPRAVAVDGSGSLLVTDQAQSTIWRVRPGEDPEVWHQSSDYASGGLQGIAVSGSRAVFVARASDPAGVGQDVVFSVAIQPDGSAGTRTEEARIPAAQRAAGVLAGRSGRTYVALEGADALLVLGAGGEEEARVTGTGAVRFDGPVGLAFSGGSVLVTNRSEPSAEAPARDLLAVAAGDEQAR